MANPQPDQFTKLSNEVLEALCHIRISGEARQVFDTIIRLTWGYKKKTENISLNQFVEFTGLTKGHVIRAVSKLLLMNLITQKGKRKGLIYSVQKDYEQWKPLPKKVTTSKLPKKVTVITKKGNKSSQKGNNTHCTNIQDNELHNPKDILKDKKDIKEEETEKIKRLFHNLNKKDKETQEPLTKSIGEVIDGNV